MAHATVTTATMTASVKASPNLVRKLKAVVRPSHHSERDDPPLVAGLVKCSSGYLRTNTICLPNVRLRRPCNLSEIALDIGKALRAGAAEKFGAVVVEGHPDRVRLTT